MLALIQSNQKLLPAQSSPSDAPKLSTLTKEVDTLAELSGAVLAELHIPTSLQEIQDSPHGPLSMFLGKVQQELCKSVDVSEKRLNLLGIRGEYTRAPSVLNMSKVPEISALDRAAGSVMVHSGKGTRTATVGAVAVKPHEPVAAMHLNQEVIVELEVLPGEEKDLTAESVFSTWQKQLKDA